MSRPIKVEQHGGLGVLWFIGWLFAIGFLKLGFWKGVLAIIVWPYFLGAHFTAPEAPPVETRSVIEQSQHAYSYAPAHQSPFLPATA